MIATTATAEIRRIDRPGCAFEAVTRVGRLRSRYALADRADALAYAVHFRTRGEAAGLRVEVRIDL